MCHYSPTLNFLSSASGGSDIIGTFLTSGEWSVNYEQFGGFCMFCDFKGKGKAKISSSLCLYVCVCFSAFVCRKSISLLEILIRSLSCGLCGGSEEVYNRFITRSHQQVALDDQRFIWDVNLCLFVHSIWFWFRCGLIRSCWNRILLSDSVFVSPSRVSCCRWITPWKHSCSLSVWILIPEKTVCFI